MIHVAVHLDALRTSTAARRMFGDPRAFLTPFITELWRASSRLQPRGLWFTALPPSSANNEMASNFLLFVLAIRKPPVRIVRSTDRWGSTAFSRRFTSFPSISLAHFASIERHSRALGATRFPSMARLPRVPGLEASGSVSEPNLGLCTLPQKSGGARR